MRYKLDNLDWQILSILKKDARTSYVNIAKSLKFSEGMIRQRVKKLVAASVIKKFTVVTATHGLKAIIDVGVVVNVHTTEIANKIKQISGVEYVYEVSGDQDIVVIVDVENALKLNDVIEEIRSMKNVQNTETKLILREI
jgi:Lrp/AsnC family transcriptional regulator for asnA, asnC and gidA